MPLGIAVLKWDDEIGPVVTVKTKGLERGIDPTTSMRTYGIVTLGETIDSEKPGFQALPFDDFNLAVYYGGLNMHLKGQPSMIFLVLEINEDPELYRDALTEIATQIFLKSHTKDYINLVPNLYKKINRYTEMNPEQRQAFAMNDIVRKTILRNLMEKCTMESNELDELVFEEAGRKIDIDIILRPLIKMGIIESGWVEGLSSEVVELKRGIFLLRTVSHNTTKAIRTGTVPKDVGEKFLSVSKEYHDKYIKLLKKELSETIWNDSERLSKVLLDFDIYDVLVELRKGPQRSEHLSTLLKMTKTKMRKIIKTLETIEIVERINSNDGNEYILLKANPVIMTVYPTWGIKKVVERYNNEEISSGHALHYLDTLENSYPKSSVYMGVE